MTRFIAAIFACLLFAAPAFSADCQTWDASLTEAAEYSAQQSDRVGAVLLTEDETRAVWPLLMIQGEKMPARLGFIILQSQPAVAYVGGFDPAGCVEGSGKLPSGLVLDAMAKAGVQSEFVILKPKGEGA